MNVSVNNILIHEFQLLADRLNSPKGFMKFVNIISEAFSLRLTVLLQMAGVNKALRRKQGETNVQRI